MKRLVATSLALLLYSSPIVCFTPLNAPTRIRFRAATLNVHHSLAMKRHVPRSSRGQDSEPESIEVDHDGIPKIGRLKNVVRQTRGDIVGTRGSVKVQGKGWDNILPKPPTIRVAGGTAKGRKLNRPEVYLRPMMGKVKEALFSILTEFDVLRDDAIALDTFAGCGSVGIEALSRGVGKAVFVDYSKEACNTIRGNLEVCEFEDRGMVVCSKAEAIYDDPVQVLAKMGGKGFDLLTMTPPYEEVDYGDLLGRITKSEHLMNDGCIVVVEYPIELGSLPPVVGNRLVGMRNRKYGRTMLAIYACNPGSNMEPRPQEFGTLRLDYL
ncbi:hypothetical protein GUITHDRAFT_151135 [Guillardia theta CCMP2712]|uniref:Uncharacterized protein n=1 Tax=Guillardia theta (strain CCMP2712) TaxID=905079 RepID=L1JRE4_GUITC|nr:hypothetical protein GUITHDRAFT_151135 [Guillardia theta CCMP2712]EKX51022.1 hypothetical protein GUITHDRAFT_151135 [Guillardia theta CCMP2712]|eukprot:XP_005838002.1 hypothetical protein GUITHDRAFT_151135 [Guillardia theta CCMP2712]